jgi:hypothetical protein
VSTVTSLRIYLSVESEEQIHETEEAIADLLIERGYNAGEGDETLVTAVIATVVDAPDVEAWGESIEKFLSEINRLSPHHLLIPGSGQADE